MLPERTCLGELELIEIYAYMNEPTIFNVKNATGQNFLVYWCDYEKEQDGWLYLPLSEIRLDKLRRQELSIKAAFETADSGFFLSYTGADPSNDTVEYKTLETIDKSLLPPRDILIEYIDVIDEEEAKWDFEFKLANLRNKGKPLSSDAMSKCVEYFDKVMVSLGSGNLNAHSARFGSFELKLGAQDSSERVNASLKKLNNILNTDTNHIAGAAFQSALDPHLLK